jgi:hypothetical protein
VKSALALAFVGLFFGFSLSRIGFTSWDEVHNMFLFADLRLTLTFVAAVALLGVAWFVIKRLASTSWSGRRIHPGTIAGGVIFGVGWSLSGACPSIALVQLGEGQLGGLVTLLGVFAGNWIYSVVHERHFRWTTSSCLDQ